MFDGLVPQGHDLLDSDTDTFQKFGAQIRGAYLCPHFLQPEVFVADSLLQIEVRTKDLSLEIVVASKSSVFGLLQIQLAQEDLHMARIRLVSRFTRISIIVHQSVEDHGVFHVTTIWSKQTTKLQFIPRLQLLFQPQKSSPPCQAK